MGSSSLTVVFGMGTCVSCRIKSPECALGRFLHTERDSKRWKQSVFIVRSCTDRGACLRCKCPLGRCCVRFACDYSRWNVTTRHRSADRAEKIKLSSVSTGQLRPLRALHTRPINLVVFQGTSTRPYLGTGFVLRCFQHLSSPIVANQRCH